MSQTDALPNRHSIRLLGYDYAATGYYFVTLVTQDRTCLFGNILDGALNPTAAGRLVQTLLDEIPAHHPGVEVDARIVMPDHIHAIIVLVGADGDGVGAGPRPRPDFDEDGRPAVAAPKLTLGDVVGRFKSLTTNRYADGVRNHGWPPFRGRLWQRNYYEHILRNDQSLHEIRKYIEANPLHWAEDEEWFEGQTRK